MATVVARVLGGDMEVSLRVLVGDMEVSLSWRQVTVKGSGVTEVQSCL